MLFEERENHSSIYFHSILVGRRSQPWSGSLESWWTQISYVCKHASLGPRFEVSGPSPYCLMWPHRSPRAAPFWRTEGIPSGGVWWREVIGNLLQKGRGKIAQCLPKMSWIPIQLLYLLYIYLFINFIYIYLFIYYIYIFVFCGQDQVPWENHRQIELKLPLFAFCSLAEAGCKVLSTHLKLTEHTNFIPLPWTKMHRRHVLSLTASNPRMAKLPLDLQSTSSYIYRYM